MQCKMYLFPQRSSSFSFCNCNQSESPKTRGSNFLILLIDSANELFSPSPEGVLCSSCKHLKAVYSWGVRKSLVALRVGRELKALCFESWTYRLCFGDAHGGWQFVYIQEADGVEEWSGARAEKEQSTCLFPLIHGRERREIKWILVKK